MQAWQNERLTYHGDFYHFENVEVLPKPIQQPHPPVWLAATSPGAVSWCAQNGHTILMDPHGTHRDIAIKRALYQEELEKAGHSMEGREIPMARNIALAATQQEAEQVARNGARFMFGSYLAPGVGAVPAEGTKTVPPESFQPETGGEDPVARYVNDVVICGTPEKVVDDLQEMQETLPLEYLMCTPLSHSSFEIFTDKVLPHFI